LVSGVGGGGERFSAINRGGLRLGKGDIYNKKGPSFAGKSVNRGENFPGEWRQMSEGNVAAREKAKKRTISRGERERGAFCPTNRKVGE